MKKIFNENEIFKMMHDKAKEICKTDENYFVEHTSYDSIFLSKDYTCRFTNGSNISIRIKTESDGIRDGFWACVKYIETTYEDKRVELSDKFYSIGRDDYGHTYTNDLSIVYAQMKKHESKDKVRKMVMYKDMVTDSKRKFVITDKVLNAKLLKRIELKIGKMLKYQELTVTYDESRYYIHYVYRNNKSSYSIYKH